MINSTSSAEELKAWRKKWKWSFFF